MGGIAGKGSQPGTVKYCVWTGKQAVIVGRSRRVYELG